MCETGTWNRDTEDVKCPWCGFSNCLTDTYSETRGTDGEMNCYDCEKPFRYAFNVSISVTTERVEK